MGSEEQIKNHSRRKKNRMLPWFVVFICATGIGVAAYETMVLTGSGAYLSMQSISDQVHRVAVLIIPAGLVLSALTWMLSELGKLGTWLKWSGRVIVALCMVCIFGTLAFVVLFDSRLEAEGLQGQFIHGNDLLPSIDALPVSDLHGFRREESAKLPGLAIEDLSLGHILTLDRKTIARKTSEGNFVWHIDRPGPPPAYLNLDGDILYYTGPGPKFEDDVVACAVKMSTGKKQWLYHCLGNWASPVVTEGSFAAFVSARPSSSSIHVLHVWPPKLQWAVRIDGVVKISPRFKGHRLQIAKEGWLIEFTIETGEELNRKRVCPKADGTGKEILSIVCKDGKVVAWRSGKSTDERPAIDFR